MSKHNHTKANGTKLSDVEINTAFNEVDDDFDGKKSTEFLIQATADRCGISYARVVDALGNVAEPKEAGR